MKAKIYSAAAQILNERYNECLNDDRSENPHFSNIKVWVSDVSSSDPNFFRWLFQNDDITDFGSNLKEDELNMYEEFLDNL